MLNGMKGIIVVVAMIWLTACSNFTDKGYKELLLEELVAETACPSTHQMFGSFPFCSNSFEKDMEVYVLHLEISDENAEILPVRQWHKSGNLEATLSSLVCFSIATPLGITDEAIRSKDSGVIRLFATSAVIGNENARNELAEQLRVRFKIMVNDEIYVLTRWAYREAAQHSKQCEVQKL